MDDFSTTYTHNELIEVFAKLFPQGFAGADVRRALAPEGWGKSPLLALFHPSPEQRFQEALRMHENMETVRLARGKVDGNAAGRADKDPEPPPTLAEFVNNGFTVACAFG